MTTFVDGIIFRNENIASVHKPGPGDLQKLEALTVVCEIPSRKLVLLRPCRVWNGGDRLRYHGERWVPKRLFYALGVQDGDATMRGVGVQAVCGNLNCVESTHLQLKPHEPPTRRSEGKKRAGAKIVDTDTDEPPSTPAEAVAQARKLMRHMHSTLDGVDVATGEPESFMSAILQFKTQ